MHNYTNTNSLAGNVTMSFWVFLFTNATVESSEKENNESNDIMIY